MSVPPSACAKPLLIAAVLFATFHAHAACMPKQHLPLSSRATLDSSITLQQPPLGSLGQGRLVGTDADASHRLAVLPPLQTPVLPLDVGHSRGPLRIGRVRRLQIPAVPLGSLPWKLLDDGRQTLRMHIISRGARALRAHLRVSSAQRTPGPFTGDLRFAGQAGHVFLAPPQGYADGGWSPIVSGDTLTIEFTLPTNSSADGLTLVADKVGHLFLDPLHPDRTEGVPACSSHPHCSQLLDARFEQATRSVATLVVMRDEDGLACSGVLLNTMAPALHTLLWTAASCVPDSDAAASLQVYWAHSTGTCQTTVAQISTVHSPATLLPLPAEATTRLIRLADAPPTGMTRAGWDLQAPGASSDIVLDLLAAPDGGRHWRTGHPVARWAWPSAIQVAWEHLPDTQGLPGTPLFRASADGQLRLQGLLACTDTDCTPGGPYVSISDLPALFLGGH